MPTRALQTWQVAQPDYVALCLLCRVPVAVCPCSFPISYLETCLMCGVVIQRPYAGPQNEMESRCAQCVLAEGGQADGL